MNINRILCFVVILFNNVEVQAIQTHAEQCLIRKKYQAGDFPIRNFLKKKKHSNVHNRWVKDSSENYTVSISKDIESQFFTIANMGKKTVENPRIIVNGKNNWYSIEDIVKEIINKKMTDREKAIAIWRFLVANRYHDYPAHDGIEMHDPVKFLNIYGYGFCDDAATNYMLLAEQAGLKARIWTLTDHVVAEVYFDNAWHMFDVDKEIFYLEEDGFNIASVKTLEKRPELILKHPSPNYTNGNNNYYFYSNSFNNKISYWFKDNSSTTHRMAFALRPGESITRYYKNKGVHFFGQHPVEPEKYGNGTFNFTPVFNDDIYKDGAYSVRDLRTECTGKDFLLVSENTGGELVYCFKSPYPFVDGFTEFSGNGKIELSYSEDAKNWESIQTTSFQGFTTVPYRSFLQETEGQATYVYYLKFTLQGQLSCLHIQSDFQCAPLSLPVLECKDNFVKYFDDTVEPKNILITFGYKE